LHKIEQTVNWYRGFGLTELIFCIAFAVFYVLYLLRIIGIARRLKTPFASVFLKLFIRTIYFGLFIIAMLGPSFGGGKKEVKSIGKDIMICIDLSKSMDAFDIQPSRLEKIKFEMKKLVSAFNSDRIGIIIFSSEAFMQCPLTYDQNALNLFIETMNTNLVPATGTDFGPPLQLAIKKMKEEEGQSGQAKSKVIILISDGEDFGEDTNEVVKEVEDENIKLFTLGVGTNKGGNIYAASGLKKDKNGNVVVSKLNSNELKQIASKADGQYFEINDSKNDVSRLINTITRIEGELREARYVDVTANKYFYFLVAAFALLLLDILINVRTVRI
jgi:Ca-activated chloride channel family protein